MKVPNWVVYAFTAAGVGLFVYDLLHSNMIGLFSDVCMIVVGIIAIWNKKNPDQTI